MIYYIADLHFGHKNVLRHDNRPFDDVAAMNETLIRNWNSRVAADDTVYVLGDAFWKGSGVEIFRRLNGHKRLIRGNHDYRGELLSLWESVEPYAEIDDGGTRVVLCHYPIPFYNRQHRGAVMLYGHVHNSRDWVLLEQWKRELRARNIPCRMINVGCMLPYVDYTPRTLAELLAADENGGADKEGQK